MAKWIFSFSPLDIHECVRQALAVSHPVFIAKELKLTVTLEASKHPSLW